MDLIHMLLFGKLPSTLVILPKEPHLVLNDARGAESWGFSFF